MFHLVLLTMAIGLLLYWLTQKPENFPPGPPRWPIIGNILEVLVFSNGKGKLEVFATISRLYGGIVGLYLGVQPTIIVSDYKLVKELSINDDLCGRPSGNKDIDKLMYKGKSRCGIIFNHGDDWREQRRFSLRHMRELGFGKMSLEGVIQEEVEDLLRQVTKKAGADFEHPVELSDLLGVASINVLWYVVARERYSHDDARVAVLTNLIRSIASRLDGAGSAYSHFPWIMALLPGTASKFQDYLDIRERLQNFILERIKEHKKTLDKNNPRDFIDVYLAEMQEQQERNKEKTSFHELQLLEIISDFFIAGFDTTFNSMAFALIYMVCYPEVQKKSQKEIDTVVGGNRLPSLSDRSSLPYVEATIEEIFRTSSVVPLAVPHAVLHASKDVPFHGYTIPKNTRILLNLAHMHSDPNLWGDPQNFRPERFLSEENKVKRPEYLMPFGIGKRQCLGETLARSNMFMFFTSIMQRFELSVPSGGKLPDSKDVIGAFTLCPTPYQAKITPRL
ncbi:LOW QUALITY PROTEIN: methyl farnesoate epoxidase-like [Neocloeon triangulifer]|uniref:LOW QUALITY PROTEIN: methyl farnesoate epoxidase-like n=1 Tax=Neocloeon triangulifer TaxID=2078957 RepID=UPI00286F7123|nr:LOW QUALITY PROTEIN: methyl farnesoate epoxidase-like [Neocloeon triangulifer]